jgi:type VI secretion system secreted protein VgrG
VNDQREKRGLGGELRSDEHVALRGGMGVLISAEAQPKANGQQLDMAEARTQLDAAAAQMKALADAAQVAQAHVAEVEKQRQFLEQRLDKLQQAVLLASGQSDGDS